MTTYVWFVRGEHHAKLCRTSIEAAKRAEPGADDEFFVVTDDDEHPALHELRCHADLLHISKGGPIMLANLDAQIAAMISSGDDRFVFLDTDVLLLKPIPQIGELTVTWRDHVLVDGEGEKIEGLAASMPYNYGVLAAKFGKPTVEAFIWMRERIRKMHKNQQDWYGNQLALAELAGPRPPCGTHIDTRRVPWLLTNHGCLINVAKIPCEVFNYTPAAADEDISRKHALHFKGKARGLMEGYAKSLGLGWYV